MNRRGSAVGLARRNGVRALGTYAPSGGDAPALPIVWSTDLTFARASAATYWDGTTFTRYSSGTARVLGDGSLYVEGSRTNYKATTNGDYSVVGSATKTDDVADGPAADAAGDADRVAFNGAAASGIEAPAADEPTFSDNTPQSFSVFAKLESGNAPVQLLMDLKGAASGSTVNVAASWARYANNVADNGTGTRSCGTAFRSITAPRDGQHLVWGWQLENNAFASQLIETSGTDATRLADDAVIASADVPAEMRSGSFKVTIKPRRASTEAADTSTETLLAFGAGTDNRIYIDAANAVIVRQGAATKVTSGALTWSADQAITLTFNAATGALTVLGATTGDGTTTTTTWTMPTGDVQVGNDAALATAFFGVITPPVAP